MVTRSISDYLASSRGLGPTAQNHLRQLVERYPYFHAARLLYLRSLYQSHDPSFGIELRKAALYVPSRKVLYQLIEGERLNPSMQPTNPHMHSRQQFDDDRTNSLIGQFLESIPQEKPRRAQKIDASVDYIEFLRQNEADSQVFSTSREEESSRASSQTDVIDAFLDRQGKIVIHDRTDEEMLKPLAAEEENGESDILTEMMAKIYIKQGKFDKALEIIRKLSLKYPKKNRYFADQMRFLEKLIINNKNK